MMAYILQGGKQSLHPPYFDRLNLKIIVIDIYPSAGKHYVTSTS